MNHINNSVCRGSMRAIELLLIAGEKRKENTKIIYGESRVSLLDSCGQQIAVTEISEETKQLLDPSKPYDQVKIAIYNRFSNCKTDIDAFFKDEEFRNTEQTKLHPDSIIEVNDARSEQWKFFIQSLHELELQRHNEKIKAKRADKLKRKRNGR